MTLPLDYHRTIVYIYSTYLDDYVVYRDRMARRGGTPNEAYCPECGTDREMDLTVPWQADFCSVCGTEIDD